MRVSVKVKNVQLPCGCTQRRISNLESNSVRVRKGDVGICSRCGSWWECIGLPHERIRYIPTEADRERLMKQVEMYAAQKQR